MPKWWDKFKSDVESAAKKVEAGSISAAKTVEAGAIGVAKTIEAGAASVACKVANAVMKDEPFGHHKVVCHPPSTVDVTQHFTTRITATCGTTQSVDQNATCTLAAAQCDNLNFTCGNAATQVFTCDADALQQMAVDALATVPDAALAAAVKAVGGAASVPKTQSRTDINSSVANIINTSCGSPQSAMQVLNTPAVCTMSRNVTSTNMLNADQSTMCAMAVTTNLAEAARAPPPGAAVAQPLNSPAAIVFFVVVGVVFFAVCIGVFFAIRGKRPVRVVTLGAALPPPLPLPPKSK